MIKEKIAPLTDEIDNIKENSHVELKETVFKCDHCEYIGSQSSVIERHITMKHKIPNHPCEVCDFKATSDSELKHHTFTSHKNKTQTKQIERFETMENSIVLSLEKNPAYGRHQLSRPMRIEGPIQS